MNEAQQVLISGPQIYTEHQIISNAALLITANKIRSIITDKKFIFPKSKVLKFPESYHLIPGFIDVHIHGANGADVMDGTFEALDTLSQSLPAEGTTSFLATTMTASKETISRVVQTTGAYLQKQSGLGANLLGIHLEGPFLALEKAGAQNAKDLLLPNINLVRAWQKLSANAIKLITLAPELPDCLALISFLKTQNIIASIGHTHATYAQTLSAVTAGCSHVTHLFNAMRGIHQREPGGVTAALLADELFAELIVDGIHLHPAIVKLITKIKNKEKIILVTDAMRAKCLPAGFYELGGQTVTVNNHQATLSDGTLAGSVLTMIAAIKNIMQFTQCSLFDAVRYATINPAKMLNIFAQKGSIAGNKDADLVVLDEGLNVVLTMVGGVIVYRA